MAAVISASQVVTLLNVDGDGIADPGDTLKLAATISNSGSDPATGLAFSDHRRAHDP